MTNLQESVKIDQLNRTVKGKKSSLQLLNLQLSLTASASVSLNDTQSATFINTLESDSGFRLFGFPNITLYVGSATANDRISDGSNIDPNDYKWSIWIDWGSTNNDNMVSKTYVQNNSGGTKTILFRSNWRFLVEGAKST